MKRIWKYLLMFVFIGRAMQMDCNGQITLDFTVDSTQFGYLFYPAKISNSETKYVFLDTVASTFSLYNLDLTPFLTNISTPHSLRTDSAGNTYFYHIMYLTRSLFDCDTSNIEYLFASQNAGYNPLWVMRTDGTVLFHKDTAVGPYCLGCPGGTTMQRPILTTESGTKLITMSSGDSGPTGARNISVYSLCGSIPVGMNEYDFPNEQSSSYIKVFPNPVSMQLNFQITLPDNLNSYDLIIFNNNSQELMRKHINESNSIYSLDVKNYSSAAYYYSLTTKDKVIQSGRFVISK